MTYHAVLEKQGLMKKILLGAYCAIVAAIATVNLGASVGLMALLGVATPALLGYMIGRGRAWDIPGAWDDH